MSRAGARDIPEISPCATQVRVFLAGSGTDDLAAYAALEDLGLAIVGEDHEWGDDGSEYPRVTRDPLDGIVDRYHFAHGGVARAGLRDRVQRTADRVRGAGADGVLYLLGPHDEAAGWELPALRECLGAGIPLVPVRLRDLASGDPAPGDLVQDVAPGERAQRDRVPADPRQRGRAERAVWAAAAAGPDRRPELREAGRRLLGELGGSPRAANRAGPGRPAAGQPRPPGDPGTSRWTGEDSRG